MGVFHLCEAQWKPGSSGAPLTVIGVRGLCMMIRDMQSTGKMSCTLRVYFSSPPQSVPLPVVGEGAVELLENVCPGA